jgi:hypothetical protein
MTSTVPFRIHAIPADVLASVRTSGIGVERIISDGGNALRCCLRDSEPGEELLLFGYEPPLPASPYREIGAVIAHAEPCAGPTDVNTYPLDWRGRPQVLRAYDERGWIHDVTRVHDGQDPEKVIAELLADPGVAQIHSRNVAWGCYMFTVTRAPA